MFRFLCKTRTRRIISCYLLISILADILYPASVMALTGGPSTPEVQSFEPISTSDMVDPFSGDFKYNIPLMDIGGYPINIAYNSGISTDQEASWTGLGWNLNVGNISRGMRGIPDDFDGTETISKEFNVKPNQTLGINIGLDFEVLGFEKKTKSGAKKKLSFKPSVGVGINYNNYTGFGVETTVGLGISAGVSGKGALDASLGLHSSSTGGLDISPNISFSAQTRAKQADNDYLVKSGGGKIGGTFNSRAGVKQLSFSASFQKSTERVSMVPTDIGPITAILPQVSTLSSRGGGSGGSINFGLQTYVPHINMPMINNSVAVNIKTSVHLWGVDADLSIGGYYSNQKLATKQRSLPAYGYMNAEKGQFNSNAMMDFNREKDGSFSRFTKNLPVSNLTYDVYSASGQGVGGTFRPFRHDIGHVFDNYGASQSDSYSLGAELGAGGLIKGGVDFTVVDVVNTTTKWTNNNKALNYFKYKDKSISTSEADDETYYFRAVGEKSADNANNQFYNGLGANDAYAIQLSQPYSNAADIKAENKLVKFDNLNASANTSAISIGTTSTPAREKRNQNFVILTIDQAKKIGLQKNYYNGTGVRDSKNTSGTEANAYVNLVTSGGVFENLHHIGEISVLNSDGARYFYGLPAYNKKQKEVNFNCSGLTPSAANGLVPYYPSPDATIDNARGTDNNFNSTSMPAYAYSYLLTAIVSVDYVDLTGDGPTDDDLGTYTKFHYKKSGTADYSWRMPVTNTGSYANYNEGSKSNVNDQCASYTYGEKELWFLDEIETKNYIATFQTSDRNDALGVAGEHGGGLQSAVKNKRLDKISLFSKPEYLSSVSPVPLKVCNFVYDLVNPLCPFTNDPLAKNSTDIGKLTLKSINFTYEKSDRAIFNSYDFTYSAFNPPYHPKAYDRWGNYKPQAAAINDAYNSSTMSNSEYPYTEQDTVLESQYAQAWQLTNVKLPTGGEINVTYESDDYAFVQNVPAGQMFSVIGAATSAPTAPVTPVIGGVQNLYSKAGSGPPYTNNIYLIVNGISPSCNTAAKFKNYYLKDLQEGSKKLYFKFLVNLRNSGTANPNGIPTNYYEYVSGYADVDPNGPGVAYDLIPSSNQAWIKLQPIGLKRQDATSNMINPIALAAIQFGRLNYGEAVWDKQGTQPTDEVQALKQLANDAKGSLKTLVTGFKNPNKALADKEYCKEFVTGKSLIRLYNGTGRKLGGGSRVSRIELNDNWQTMTTAGGGFQDNSYYGQRYEYKTTDENGRTISSGVASYEPMIGSEENSMKQPRIFGAYVTNKWTMMAPDDRYFTEGPYGESFFPSPSVGYSKVRVTSIFPSLANKNVDAPNILNNQKNGYKVYQFYTSKDYPTITDETQIMPKQHRPPLGGLIKIFSKDFIYTSQGYVIRTNDMHGKPMAELDYAEKNPAPIKEVWFYYKTNGGQYYPPTQRNLYTDASYNRNELNNLCNVISNDGKVNQKLIGSDFDAVADFRESETNTTNVGTQNNLATFLLGVFPGIFPTVFPRYNKEISRFRSAVLTKVINEYGILERTVVKENGATITTENLAFDSETGDVLVTKTKNEFSDDIYNLKYPAHWGYDLMGHAYKNVGIEFKGMSINSSGIASGPTLVNAAAYFLIGDEVGIYNGSGVADKAWVCSISGNTIGLIDRNGNNTTLNYSNVNIKVVRSARRNLLRTEMATLTSAENPLPNVGGVITYGSALNITTSNKVVNANGTVFSDTWQMPKGVINTNGGNNCNCTTVTPLGTDFINSIVQIFNNPNNAPNPNGPYISSFFNGITSSITNGPPVVLNNTPNILGVDYLKGNHIYRQSTGYLQFGPLITPGFTPFSSPNDYGHYGITPNIYAQLPGLFSPFVGNSPEVGWAGPPANILASPFNANNQLIGYYMTDDPRCYVTLDFGVNNPWNPTFAGYIKMLAYTAGPGGTYVTLVPNANQTACTGNSLDCTFSIKDLANNTVLSTYPIKITSSCLTNLVSGCTSSGGGPLTFQCGKLVGDKVNPFVMGIKGNWRAKSNYTYLTKRNQTLTTTTNNTDIRKDGYFTSFSAVYSPVATNTPWTLNLTNWTNTVQSTKYNQYGVEIENMDALGRYSSALYGYNESLPIAVASNAQLREIAFDGFEDYSYYPVNCNKEGHFNFVQNIAFNQVTLDGSNSHTGKFSLKMLNNSNVSVTKKVSAIQQAPGANGLYCSYLLSDFDFIYPFSPVSLAQIPANGVDYIISYWVKQDPIASAPITVDYLNSKITVLNSLNAPFVIKNLKRSAIIDGWQKEEYTFNIPNGYAGDMYIKVANSSGQTAYFDDIRMHPFSSNMKAYVYHPVTLKYAAELDANNFATFYEYDAQGNLVRVKKETDKGIMTIQESKTHSRRF